MLERGVAAFLGTVSVQGRSVSVQSADRRLNLYCTVQPADLKGAHAAALKENINAAVDSAQISGL